MLDTLESWDGHLAAHGAQLISARVDLVNQLAPEVEKAYQLLAPASRPAAIKYRSSVGTVEAEAAAGTVDPAVYETAAARGVAGTRGPPNSSAESCLVGPHRDDLDLRLGEQPAEGIRQPWRILVDGTGFEVGGLRTAARRRVGSGATARRRVRRTRQCPPAGAGQGRRLRRSRSW